MVVDQEPLAQKECLQIPEFERNLDMMLSRKGMSPCKISEVGDLLFNVFPLTVGISLIQVVLLSQGRYALLGKRKLDICFLAIHDFYLESFLKLLNQVSVVTS